MSKPEFFGNTLVPELACLDFAASLTFYLEIVGATIAYEREGFAYLKIGDAELMLEGAEGCWQTAVLDAPLGRGVNFQIDVADVDAIAERCKAANIPFFRDMAENWYRANDIEHGQREFLVQDPSGYLLRFAQYLGERPVERAVTQ